MTAERHGWRAALDTIPLLASGRWAITGSAALALHGLTVEPSDLDVLADPSAADGLTEHLRACVVSDQAMWDRGDVRASRRVLLVVAGIDVEVLVGVESVVNGVVRVSTQDLDHVDQIAHHGRQIPVLPLRTLVAILEATGKSERASLAKAHLSRST